MTYWLIFIFAMITMAYRKQLMTILQWHPAILLGNVVFIALIIGFYLVIRLVHEEFAWWGIGGLLVAGILLHSWHRWKYGYWLGD